MALTELQQIARDLTTKGRALANAESRLDLDMVAALTTDIDLLLDRHNDLTRAATPR